MRNKFSTSSNDEYYTPRYGVNIIEPYCKKYKKIWCPFDKAESNYVKIFEEQGHEVVYTHIETGQDFLTYEPDFEFDAIVSNPPFSIKNKIIKRCQEFNKPYCLLLPYSMFFAKSSIQLVNGNIQLLMIDDRISYNGSRANFNSWYVGGNNFFEKDINFYIFKESPLKLYKDELTKNII